MSSISIRAAQLDDLDAFLAIARASFPFERFTRRRFRDRLLYGKSEIWVVCRADEVLGLGILQTPKHPRPARIEMLALYRSERRKGFGQRLLTVLCERSKALDYTRIRLEVRKDANDAKALYRSMGFITRQYLHRYYADDASGERLELQF